MVKRMRFFRTFFAFWVLPQHLSLTNVVGKTTIYKIDRQKIVKIYCHFLHFFILYEEMKKLL